MKGTSKAYTLTYVIEMTPEERLSLIKVLQCTPAIKLTGREQDVRDALLNILDVNPS